MSKSRAFTIKPYPEWSWSQSRDGVFKECPRKYYYNYYQSHNGWLRDASEKAKTAYRLKQISNLYLLLGDGIHQIAEAALRKWQTEKLLPAAADSLQFIRQHLNQAYLDSKQKERWARAPKKSVMLHEMYYGGQLPERRVEQIKQRMPICVDNFHQSQSLQEVTTSEAVRIAEIEELNTFELAGNKVYVKLDLLYQQHDQWLIVDWKTGSESEQNDEQVLLYALFLQNKYGVSLQDVEIRIEYLLAGECMVVQVQPEDLQRIEQQVADSANEMKQLLADKNENKPLPVEAFEALPERLKCTFCNFREICDEKII